MLQEKNESEKENTQNDPIESTNNKMI